MLWFISSAVHIFDTGTLSLAKAKVHLTDIFVVFWCSDFCYKMAQNFSEHSNTTQCLVCKLLLVFVFQALTSLQHENVVSLLECKVFQQLFSHTRLLKYGSVYAGFKTKEYKKIKKYRNTVQIGLLLLSLLLRYWYNCCCLGMVCPFVNSQVRQEQFFCISMAWLMCNCCIASVVSVWYVNWSLVSLPGQRVCFSINHLPMWIALEDQFESTVMVTVQLWLFLLLVYRGAVEFGSIHIPSTVLFKM